MKEYLFGFDCGTYESKGVIADNEGNIYATAVAKHILKVPKPGYAEHDPLNDWWCDFKKITAELLEKAKISSSQIAGIGISTIMAAITPIDEDGNPLRNAILYGIDTRCQRQVKYLNETIGEKRMKEISGDICTVESFGPKILWIKENEPEIFAKTKQFTIASGFLAMKLTGNNCTDKYSVNFAQPILNYRTMDWSDELCEYVCPKSMLPHIGNTTDICGTVTAKAARETGLCEGTKVIIGTTDAAAEAFSVGVVEPGDTMLMYGSTIFILNVTEQLNRFQKLWSGVYTFQDSYATTAGMATTGSLTRWIRDEWAKELVAEEANGGDNAYTALFREAENIAPGSDGLIILPYFAGERMPIQDPNAKGMIFGLNLSHTRGHVIHAAMEGIAMGLAQNLSLIKEMGGSLECVTAVGGGTKSKLWMQIISDICGVRQAIPEVTVGASYGDAMLAGIGIGVIADRRDVKKWISIKYETVPNPKNCEVYEKYKSIYDSLYKRTMDLMHII